MCKLNSVSNRKISLLLLLHFFICATLSAQNAASYSLKIVVKDSISNFPLSNATVDLMDSVKRNLKTTLSNPKGETLFKLNRISNYYVSIKHIGYLPVEIFVRLDGHQKDTVLPPIKLVAEIKALKPITVASQKPPFSISLEKLIVNVSESAVFTGMNSLEIIQRSPNIQLIRNEVKLNGKTVVVLVDGKQTNLSGEELNQYLFSLQANMIDKIELISNPPASYDAQGAAIINIKTMVGRNFGTNGSFVIGAGFGRFPRSNGGVTLNNRTKKTNTFGGYDLQYSETYNLNNLDRFVTSSVTTRINDTEYDVRKRISNSLRFGFDHDVNKNTSFGFSTRINWNIRDRLSQNDSKFGSGYGIDSVINVSINGSADYLLTYINSYFKTKMNSKGQELTINADAFYYLKSWENDFTNTYFDSQNIQYKEPYVLRDNAPARNNIHSIALDLTNPIKNGSLNFGTKLTIIKTDNNLRWETLQANNVWQIDTTRTNHFLYDENTFAAYGTFTKRLKKYSLILGLRLEHTATKGNSLTIDSIFRKGYTKLFPTAAFEYSLNTKNQVSVTFRRSITRPNFAFVNPFIIFQNQYSAYRGNPDLNPQFTSSLELSHSYAQKIFTNLSWTRISDIFTQVARQDDLNKTITDSHENIGSYDVFSVGITVSHQIIKKYLNTTLNTRCFLARFNDPYLGGSYEAATPGVTLSIYNSLTLPKDFSADLNLSVSTRASSGLNVALPVNYFDFGIRKSLFEKAGSVALNVSDMFNSLVYRYNVLYQNLDLKYSYKSESRFIRLTFSYKFGNNNVRQNRQRRNYIETDQNRIGVTN